jgi:hypothetical protein
LGRLNEAALLLRGPCIADQVISFDSDEYIWVQRSISLAISSGRNFSATKRCSFTSYAWLTTPQPTATELLDEAVRDGLADFGL